VLSGEAEKTNVIVFGLTFNPSGSLYNRSFERWKSWIDESNSDTFLKGEYYAKICIGFLREIFYKAMQEIDRICGVTVSMLSKSAVDRGFKTRTG
jgi:hypothetical protein